MKITSRDLQRRGACGKGLFYFRRTWPRGSVNGVTVNRANLRKANRLGFDIGWVADCFPRNILDWYLKQYNLRWKSHKTTVDLLLEGAQRTDAWKAKREAKRKEK